MGAKKKEARHQNPVSRHRRMHCSLDIVTIFDCGTITSIINVSRLPDDVYAIPFVLVWAGDCFSAMPCRGT